MKHYTRILLTLLGCVGLFCAAIPAQASAMFEFDVEFTSGPVDPKKYTGEFWVDSLTGSGTETYTPGGSPGGKLEKFEIAIPTVDEIFIRVVEERDK